jgi:ferritin-like metal-binding protein YciE
MAERLSDRLTGYLVDAHSIEEQSLAQLRRAPDIAGDALLAAALRSHLADTESHERTIRALLAARGAAPSNTIDIVMRAGGRGFVLFAELQPDTPGKLAAHALSYEALEWASYDLLARTADRAGEPHVARAARAIQQQEREMMQRLESLFDATAESAVRATGSNDLHRHLVHYLADAHAIEAQSLTLLESGAKTVSVPALREVFRAHLDETRQQQHTLEARLSANESARSLIKDAALRIGAFNWGMFFQAQPDTDAKLAAFAYAVEHLEIGGYEQLRRVAQRAGDAETAAEVERILEQERGAADAIAATFEDALAAVL